jgi:DNA-binding transcriptional MerR regulator
MPAAEQPLLTLTEVANRTKISMPTLQRYKKLYQDRIPSVGEGRKQRYPEAALDVFEQLKKENVSRRGRPRKNAQAAPKAAPAAKKTRGRKPAAKKSAAAAKSSGEELLTLTQISNMTGVSYPTLLRYVKTNLKNIPHVGTGRARRYKPEAVAVFKDMRSRSKRGRKPKAASGKPSARVARKTTGGRRGRPPKTVDPADLLARINELEKNQRQLERLYARQQKQLDKPLKLVLQRR